jgi:hypothetical protein
LRALALAMPKTIENAFGSRAARPSRGDQRSAERPLGVEATGRGFEGAADLRRDSGAMGD